MTLKKLGPNLSVLLHGWHRGPSGDLFIVMEYFPGGCLGGRPHNEPAVAEFEVDFRPAATHAQTLGAPCMVHGAEICCHSLISGYGRIAYTSNSKIRLMGFGSMELCDCYKPVPCSRDTLMAPEMRPLTQYKVPSAKPYGEAVDTRSPDTIIRQLLAEAVNSDLRDESYQRLEE